MTDDNLIPASVGRAAQRGFIRTTAQAYAASIPTGLSVGVVGDAFENPTKTAITVAITLLAPILAGLASFFSIIGNGVPADYQVNEFIETPVVPEYPEIDYHDDVAGDL